MTAYRGHIAAGTDEEAVGAWLAEYRNSPQTWRAYRKEAERLLLWLQSQGLGLRDLRRDHLARFDAFLADPRPADHWIGPTRPRDHSEWRPFRQPLSASSRRQSLVILQGLCSWLVEAGWIEHNPFRLMRGKRRRLDNRQASIERYLERPLWEWLWQWLERLPSKEASRREWMLWQRRRLIFAFAYLLAPRISEMADARMNDFIRREGHWWWQVVGKGGKQARVPVPPDMLELLGEWRMALGLTARPEPDDDGPLLRSLNGQRGVGDNQLYRLIKTTFEEAAQALESEVGEGALHMANILRRASPHWLRHTAITHQAQAGVELRYLAKTARHSRLDTTARYLHTEAEEWQRQLAGHGVRRRDEPGSEPL
ncbi:tyrosine-type recombinase/integrase [Litchfieldella qijiaojingensis]|uniref:tyrosine-type recombinase/integrase n=1 Tax=Litchfieldella qijiaojingensis TaxID=980347 RepID=UPI001E363847|nr:site-specific integrase [Halomonas qijiaojingensis]